MATVIRVTIDKNKYSAVILIVILSFGTCFAAGAPAAEEIVFSGSSTFEKRILEPVMKQLEKNIGAKIRVLGVGTISGIAALVKGEATAAVASSPLDLAFRESGVPSEGTYQEHLIMKDTIVAIVNPKNPVQKLTWEKLAEINSGKITNWKEVGGRDERIVVVAGSRSSGDRAVVRDMVMEGHDYAESAYTTVTPREAIDIVAKSPIAIGVLSEGFVKMNRGKVKVLKTKPLTRDLCIITKNDISPSLAAIIKYLKSPKAKKLFL